MTSSSRRRAARKALVRQLILVVFLVILWLFLWENTSITHVLTGILVALAVTRLFYLPPVELPVRVNIFHLLNLLVWFLWSMAIAAIHVAWIATRPRRVSPGSIIAVEFHTSSDLMLTLAAQISGLIPGTFVVEVDRAHSIVYMHALNCNTDAEVEKARNQAYTIEKMLIKAFGSPHEIAVCNDWRRDRGLEPILRGHSLTEVKQKKRAREVGRKAQG